MFSLTQRYDDVIKWYGVSIELNLSFDNVLLLFKMLKDKELSHFRKLDTAIAMLVVDKELLIEVPPQRRLELLKDILREKLDFDLDRPKDSDDENDLVVPVYDWEEDAELIYASFLMDYQIDLFEQQGILTWYKFLALFKNLRDNTPLGKAIHYRTCKVPKKTEHNEEERRHVRKMKEKYALKCAQPIIDELERRAYEQQMKARKEAIKAQQNK